LGYPYSSYEEKLIDLPQFDGYHQYPVDKHSIESLKSLERVKEPLLVDIYNSLSKDEKTLLKVVTLLHDAGKGRKKDHHIVGVSLFRVFASKIGIKDNLIQKARILFYTIH